MKSKRLKCYIYIRVSTAMQVDGYSLEAQNDRLTKYAEFQGMEVVKVYCDAGKSGKTITGRPEFTQMLQDVADGKDSGKLTITVLSAVAEIERENILVQTMEGRKQKAREGKWNGGQAPFGYTLDSKNSTLIINPEEAELVKLIYQKYVYEDMGLDTIASFLNDCGYKKKKTRRRELDYFIRGTVKNILDNPVYVGKIAYGKNVTEKVKGTRDQFRRVKSDDYLLVDGIYEAIIDEELWAETKAKRKITGAKWNKTHSLEHEHILSGIVKCPICGHGISGTVRRRTNKKTGEYVDDFYYRCQHRHKIDDEHFCDFRLSLNQNELNSEVEQVILDMVNHESFRQFVMDKVNTKVDVSALEEERERIRKLLRQVMGAKAKLTDMLDKLDVMDKHYDRKYQDMHDRLDNLYDKISEYEDSIADITAKIEAVYGNQITGKQIYDILVHFEMMYYKMTDLEKKEFMKDFINSIELYPEKMDNGSIVKRINFKFGVYYEGHETMDIRLLNEKTVECIVLMSKVQN